MNDALTKAQAAAEAANAKLAALRAEEDARQAEIAAQRLEEQKVNAARFLADLASLEAQVKGSVPSNSEKAAALSAGTLPALVAEYLAGRDALSMLRDHARQCARLLERDERTIAEVRWIDPAEEIKRWQEDAITLLRSEKANALAADILADYEGE
ncbi:hypothetical protein ADL28_04420 [Streptomyces violaceusniger]|uniref:Uncharacterized protein n=1 Tax=Streptomyces violaceusniger TaxID=68280 RepID=A0A0X3XAD0_STRVO|nr:hypothetical protein [Streptomyces violaceusniger]KUL66093.1 hypothetical protein ADL28_04420 [Streptomyces violaceusniger]